MKAFLVVLNMLKTITYSSMVVNGRGYTMLNAKSVE